jgi:hypothetical protein
MIATLLAAALALQNEEFAQAAKKAAELESYAFRVEEKGAKGKKETPALEGRFQKDQPLSLKAGSTEGFKKAGVVVAKEGEEFKKVERQKKGQKKDASPALAFYDVKLPHEQFEGFEKSFQKIEKAADKDGECSVWTGTLTPEAARGFASSGSKADAKANLTYAGTCKVWVNAQGVIAKIEASVDVKGQARQKDVDLHLTKTITLTEIGTAKVELPEAAKKALEG